ncbi:hypothetical protein [Pajaroellobacter abortibovis]|uniref:Uncharacterized protein n=1 Tax=Pajaroellobacter abortibovis TaxID=1882918 RepID=A0A1L6MWD1_9BACT|nr:hypothetical protein [Pajaroellobacter abortibovis]APR99831.1 hypothetical protein BCY86_03425 [Pajaroellobacter abortibovis]
MVVQRLSLILIDGGFSFVADDLSEVLAEEFIASATSGEEQGEEYRDMIVEEEIEGPFVKEKRRKDVNEKPRLSKM